MDVLSRIMAERRQDVREAARKIPLQELEAQARGRRHHSLRSRLAAVQGTRVIAELKKASPSRGILREDYRPAEISAGYAAAGAVAVSVLTEPRHFLGEESHLRAVRAAVELPVLRKDFMCSPYQIAEAAAWGADLVLLIVAALEPTELREFHQQALGYGLEVLVETHTESELEAALALDEAIVGVNSRDLRTLKTDLAVAHRLARLIPAGRPAIAESGIHHRADIEALERSGYSGFLIGEALVTTADPAARLRELRGALHG